MIIVVHLLNLPWAAIGLSDNADAAAMAVSAVVRTALLLMPAATA
jgi:hypothetical protein